LPLRWLFEWDRIGFLATAGPIKVSNKIRARKKEVRTATPSHQAPRLTPEHLQARRTRPRLQIMARTNPLASPPVARTRPLARARGNPTRLARPPGPQTETPAPRMLIRWGAAAACPPAARARSRRHLIGHPWSHGLLEPPTRAAVRTNHRPVLIKPPAQASPIAIEEIPPAAIPPAADQGRPPIRLVAATTARNCGGRLISDPLPTLAAAIAGAPLSCSAALMIRPVQTPTSSTPNSSDNRSRDNPRSKRASKAAARRKIPSSLTLR